MVSIEVLYQVKVQLVMDWSSRLQMLEISTKVDFLRIFQNFTFLRFLKFICSLCKKCYMHFILSEQDSTNRIDLDSSIL